jgi:hypothetical protein
MESTGNAELDKLLQDVKRTILENRDFLETLKQEPLAEEPGAEGNLTDSVCDEPFEEL